MKVPIPDLSLLRSDKSAYRKHAICPKKEACIKINDLFLCRSYYWHYNPRPEGATEEIFLREKLVLKLKEIEKRLRYLGLRLLIQEGHRSLSVQRFVQEVSVVKGLRKENPKLDDMELQKLVKDFAASANGDLQTSPPPHITGGAVDLTLVKEDGCPVDMGKSGGLYNTAFPDALENRKESEFQEAKRFRRLLYWQASSEGIVVNPTEWWHLSWGDQMWAWASKAPHAIYGSMGHLG